MILTKEDYNKEKELTYGMGYGANSITITSDVLNGTYALAHPQYGHWSEMKDRMQAQIERNEMEERERQLFMEQCKMINTFYRSRLVAEVGVPACYNRQARPFNKAEKHMIYPCVIGEVYKSEKDVFLTTEDI